ncbi:hypothetical protein DFAR_1110084 [Desulfarculales bacterium]
MVFLTQTATKSMIATRWQGVIPVSRGQGCSTTLGHFLIPGPISKVQDNGIKSLNKKSVLIIDEASLHRLEALAELHTITQFQRDPKPILPIILAGQNNIAGLLI